VVYISVYPI